MPATLYRGGEILVRRADRDFDASENVDAFNSILESKAGLFEVFAETRRKAWNRSFLWTSYCRNGRADLIELEAFIARRQGRYVPFWVPTWVMDLELAQPADAGDKTITVRSSEFNPADKHLAVITPTTIEPFMIAGVVDNGDTMDLRLWHDVTDPGLSVGIIPRATMLSFLKYVRLESDQVPIVFSAGGMAEANLELFELPWEAP